MSNDPRHELLSELREQAAARIATLSAALAELTRDRAGANDDDEHDPEGVTLSSEWSRLNGLADAARAELRQVDDALRRLATGAYGRCARCGAPIPPKRLDIRPFAEHCVTCAEFLAR